MSITFTADGSIVSVTYTNDATCYALRSPPRALRQSSEFRDRAFLDRRSNISDSFRHCRQQEQPRHHCHC